MHDISALLRAVMAQVAVFAFCIKQLIFFVLGALFRPLFHPSDSRAWAKLYFLHPCVTTGCCCRCRCRPLYVVYRGWSYDASTRINVSCSGMTVEFAIGANVPSSAKVASGKSWSGRLFYPWSSFSRSFWLSWHSFDQSCGKYSDLPDVWTRLHSWRGPCVYMPRSWDLFSRFMKKLV